jgi:hypothetical protein
MRIQVPLGFSLGLAGGDDAVAMPWQQHREDVAVQA